MLGPAKSPQRPPVTMQSTRAFTIPHACGVAHLFKMAATLREALRLLLRTAEGIEPEPERQQKNRKTQNV